MVNPRQLMSDAKFYESYSRWEEENEQYEAWDGSVDRVMGMHTEFYKKSMNDELAEAISFATDAYKDKLMLGAQRALQFGGDQLLKHHSKIYNCTSSYCDRPAFFGEVFFQGLSGAGVGFSVQWHHIARLPAVTTRTGHAKQFVVKDSIEGWAEALDILMSSFFVGGGKHPEYEGRKVYFDTNSIRPKGAYISGGFKAPGPEPLEKALNHVERMLCDLTKEGETLLRPVHAYDIVMYSADAVISGGIRRAACICIFSPDDEEMMKAKTGAWFNENPQRGRSNNSALLVRSEVTREQFAALFKNTKEFGEPGFIFAESKEFIYNPCVEIGMLPVDVETGESGWQGCNLVEINGGQCTNEYKFYRACEAGAIIGTLQAGYTDFKFLSPVSKKIYDKEALIGVSVTGWMNNPDVLFDEKVLRKGAEIVKSTNARIANLIGINPSARCCTVKPAGNTSVLLGTASGIHAEHSKRYLRIMQMNKDSEVAQLIKKSNPYMVEDSVWSNNGSDYALFFPIEPKEGSVYREGVKNTDLLEKVKFVQQTWIEAGTNVELCSHPKLRHNVSNTITVDEDKWDEVEQYVYENREWFAGVSFLSNTGDKDYNQAPNTEVLTKEEIIGKYGTASLFASGLIVDSLKGFANLWDACTIAQMDEDTASQEVVDIRSDWIRRFRKFADNYFEGDMKQTEYCLKDVYILFKWEKINSNLTDIDFLEELGEKDYVDVDTLGAVACQGGVCELV